MITPGSMAGFQAALAARWRSSAAKSSAVLNSRRQPGQPSMNHQLISQMLISQIMGIMGNCCGCEKPFWVPSTKWAYL